MDAISKIKVADTEYEIKDETARGGVIQGTLAQGESVRFTTVCGILIALCQDQGGCWKAYIQANGIVIDENGGETLLLENNAWKFTSIFDNTAYILIGCTLVED